MKLQWNDYESGWGIKKSSARTREFSVELGPYLYSPCPLSNPMQHGLKQGSPAWKSAVKATNRGEYGFHVGVSMSVPGMNCLGSTGDEFAISGYIGGKSLAGAKRNFEKIMKDFFASALAGMRSRRT